MQDENLLTSPEVERSKIHYESTLWNSEPNPCLA